MKLEDCIRELLSLVGEDPDREGLQDTPIRVSRMYEELFSGLGTNPAIHFKKQFSTTNAEMVILKNLPFYSSCEHHLLPFHGVCHIAYIPGKVEATDNPLQYRIAGLSKFVRVLEEFSHRPQIQEQLTSQIANCIQDSLNPLGCMVVMEAEHLCMSMRGVQKPGTTTITSAVRGIFETNKDGVKQEFFGLLKGL